MVFNKKFNKKKKSTKKKKYSILIFSLFFLKRNLFRTKSQLNQSSKINNLFNIILFLQLLVMIAFIIVLYIYFIICYASLKWFFFLKYLYFKFLFVKFCNIIIIFFEKKKFLKKYIKRLLWNWNRIITLNNLDLFL